MICQENRFQRKCYCKVYSTCFVAVLQIGIHYIWIRILKSDPILLLIRAFSHWRNKNRFQTKINIGKKSLQNYTKTMPKEESSENRHFPNFNCVVLDQQSCCIYISLYSVTKGVKRKYSQFICHQQHGTIIWNASDHNIPLCTWSTNVSQYFTQYYTLVH